MTGARRATAAFFFLLGAAVAVWASLVPFVKATLGLDEARLSLFLLTFGVGSIVSSLGAPWVARRTGHRAVLVVGGAGMAASLPLLAVTSAPWLLGALLLGFGLFAGLTEVGANAQAIVVQSRMGRSQMSLLHGLYSVGGLVGAALGALALGAGMSTTHWTLLASVALLVLVATQARHLASDGFGADGASEARPGRPPVGVLLVGLMTMVLYLSEGAVLDWSAVFLHDHRGYDLATAGLGYAAFSVTMATGRLLGDRVVDRLGASRVVGAGTLLAASGFALLVLAPWQAASLGGCALIGLGASNVVPTLISQSARVPGVDAARAVATVSAMGTGGLLAGPALIGFAAQATSLQVALGGLAVLLLAVSAGARSLRTSAR